eukprot:5993913-Amphidinium_carterae.1
MFGPIVSFDERVWQLGLPCEEVSAHVQAFDADVTAAGKEKKLSDDVVRPQQLPLTPTRHGSGGKPLVASIGTPIPPVQMETGLRKGSSKNILMITLDYKLGMWFWF